MSEDPFVEFVLDSLSSVGDVRAKRMFGGFGLYSGKKFFGIISDGVLYFKTNIDTRIDYEEHGSEPFRPNEKQVLKNYYEVPADILEDRESLTVWAEKSLKV